MAGLIDIKVGVAKAKTPLPINAAERSEWAFRLKKVRKVASTEMLNSLHWPETAADKHDVKKIELWEDDFDSETMRKVHEKVVARLRPGMRLVLWRRSVSYYFDVMPATVISVSPDQKSVILDYPGYGQDSRTWFSTEGSSPERRVSAWPVPAYNFSLPPISVPLYGYYMSNPLKGGAGRVGFFGLARRPDTYAPFYGAKQTHELRFSKPTAFRPMFWRW
jgi:hypothetical protein